MDGPKKMEAELVLARRVTGGRGAVSEAFAWKEGCGSLLPVSRLRGTGESRAGGGGAT